MIDGLYIPKTYINGLLGLPKYEFAALMKALVEYVRNPQLYEEALPPAPLSVHDLLAELISIQGI